MDVKNRVDSWRSRRIYCISSSPTDGCRARRRFGRCSAVGRGPSHTRQTPVFGLTMAEIDSQRLVDAAYRRPNVELLLKRAYEKPAKSDGVRILVDRLWPRGISKVKLSLDMWAKDVSPSTALRKWFGHDPERWQEFEKRYKAELKEPEAREAISAIVAPAKHARAMTLIYGAKDTQHNEAVVLRGILKRRLGSGKQKSRNRNARRRAHFYIRR